MKIIKNNKLLTQIFKFLIVGGMAFVIDYSLLYILTDIINIHYFISSIISFTISFIFNYIASIKWVFKAKKQTPRELFIFLTLSLIGLGINQLIMYAGVDIFKVYYMITKIVATAVVMVFNFITRKIFIEEKE